jgi:hypothetical protein
MRQQAGHNIWCFDANKLLQCVQQRYQLGLHLRHAVHIYDDVTARAENMQVAKTITRSGTWL